MRGEIAVEGRDLYDMVTGEFGTDPTTYTIFNVMLPRVYFPDWQGNIFERVGHSIAEQLCGEGMTLDFDQLLAKQPGRGRCRVRLAPGPGVLDQHRRPSHGHVLARVDDSTIENGCMQFLPGSHGEPVRPHRPAGASREEQHTLVTDLRPDDHPVPVPIRRGDITVHNEGVLHGSGGNTTTASWRRAYINAYRSFETVRRERELGFTHSHNDDQDVLARVDGLHT